MPKVMCPRVTCPTGFQDCRVCLTFPLRGKCSSIRDVLILMLSAQHIACFSSWITRSGGVTGNLMQNTAHPQRVCRTISRDRESKQEEIRQHSQSESREVEEGRTAGVCANLRLLFHPQVLGNQRLKMLEVE